MSTRWKIYGGWMPFRKTTRAEASLPDGLRVDQSACTML
jgi:hypothetical protein